MNPEDTRTLGQLAREALLAHNACNLSGVVHSWSRAVKRLRELCPDLGTDAVNTHPLNVLYSDKLVSLAGGFATGDHWTRVYSDALQWAERELP